MRRVLLLCGAMPALALCGVAATPTGTLLPLPGWNPLSPGSNPGARAGAAMAYDGKELVLFGGTNQNLSASAPFGDTWIWNGATWTQVTGLAAGTTAPTARVGASIAYDEKNGNVVLFGGRDGSNTLLGDTWIWSSSTQAWTRAATTGVSARELSSMVYDPNSKGGAGAVILFGGSANSGGLQDMYQWSGTAWSPISAGTLPPARGAASMVYDRAHGRVVLFGGDSGTINLSYNGFSVTNSFTFNDTWLWNGINWAAAGNVGTPPSARGYAAAAFIDSVGQVVLTGGFNVATGAMSDTWVWNGSVWLQDLTAGPGNRWLSNLAYDPATGQSLLFGGTSSDDNTWNLSASTNMGSIPVGASGASVGTLTLNFAAVGGSVTFSSSSAVNVLTQGAANLDFNLNSTTCSGTLAANAACQVVVNFSPRFPGARNGAVQLVDGSGTVLASPYVYGSGSGPQVTFPPGLAPVTLGSGFPAPTGVAVDGSGNVYVADYRTSAVIKVPYSGGVYVTPVTLGSGFLNPYGVAVDGAGNVYVADTNNYAVKKVPYSGGTYGTPVTLGSGFINPTGVSVDGAGNVYVADVATNAVKKVPYSGGSYGTPVTLCSCFSNPYGVAVDGAGNVYVTDSLNDAVKKVPYSGGSYGTPVTLGSGFSYPMGVSVDGAGNVYVTDSGNSAVKKVPYSGSSYGTPVTLGSGFSNLYGLTVDGAGNVYVADGGNSAVKKIDLADAPSVTFPTATASGTADTTDGQQTVTLANSGNQPLVFSVPSAGTNPSVSAGYTVAAGSSANCPQLSTVSGATSLAAGASCTLPVSFAPVANTPTGTVSGQVVVRDNALNAAASQTITLSGSAVNTGASALTITNAPRTASVNAVFQFTVNALDANNNVNPGYRGTVHFTSSDGGATLPADYAFTSADAGTHTFSATLVAAGTQTVTATDGVNGLSAKMGVGVSVPGLVVTTFVDDPSPTDQCGSAPTNGPTACRANVLMTEIANCPVGNSPASNNCSLRDALAAATALGSGNITFDPTVFATARTTSLAGHSTLSVPSYTTINGPTRGSGATLTNLLTIDGGGGVGIFSTDSSANVTLNNLVVRNGGGSGISMAGGSVTVNQCSLVNNAADNGGGINIAAGTLTVNGSTLSGNTANTSQYGGGGGLYVGGGSVTLNNTTIANNTVTQGGRGSNAGGGIYVAAGTVNVRSSTITGNLVSLSNSNNGGGIYNSGGTVTLYDSIVKGNQSANYPNVQNVRDGGGNYYNPTSNGFSQTPDSPNLSALGSYGGPTQTMVPLPGSAAICAAVTTNVTPAIGNNQSFTDQRGVTHSAGYCSASQMDAGAVQTSYAIGFTQQPTNTLAGQTITPSPMVSVTENGAAQSGDAVTLTASAGTLSGTTSQSTGASGAATFSGLSISPAATGETLTATLTLSAATNPVTAISATSNTFNVTVPPPTVTGISPNGGPTTGGTAVTITGTNFVSPATVYFGSVAATSVNVSNATTITAVAPASAISGTNTVDVTVSTANGTSATSSADQFIYYAPQSYTVTTLTDDTQANANANYAALCPNNATTATCSLRDAIAAANALPAGVTATISFASALTSGATAANPAAISVATMGTLKLTGSGLVTINGPTSGTGSGRANLLAIDGGYDQVNFSTGVQIFNVTGAGSTAFNNLIVRNGNLYNGNAGGIGVYGGTVTVNNSTLKGNSGYGAGGIFVFNSKLTVNNSTLSNNASNVGAALVVQGSAVVTVNNSTISANTGFDAGVDSLGGTTTLNGVTISGNGGSGIRVSGGSVSVYNSLVSDVIYGTLSASSNNVFSSANLSALGYYGGPTQTMVPLPGSAAICAGAVSNLSPTPGTNQAYTDQRGATHSATYCTSSQLDAGAVQTSYSLGSAFTTQPPSVVAPGVAISPSPAVTVTENGAGAGGATVGMSAATGTLSGTTSVNSAAITGLTTFSNLKLSGALPNDSLTATVVLTPSYSLTLNSSTFSSLALSAPAILTGQAGVVYSQSVTAANGSGSYNYAVTSVAQLPNGLSLNQSTGAITGTPKAAGNFQVTVTVTDTVSSATASATFTLQIAPPTIIITPTTLPTLTVGVTSTLSFAATGGTSTYVYSFTGTLPAGLSLNSSTGAVTGTPTTASAGYNFTIFAKDSTAGAGAPYSGSQVYTAPVGKGTTTVSFTPASLTQTYNGSSLAVSATISTGGIPLSELTITYTGTGGTTYGPSITPPTAAGTYSVSATLADANYTGSAGPSTFTIGKASLTLTAGSYSGVYDGKAHALSACVASSNPDGLTCTNNPAGTVGPDVGSASVAAVASGSTANYTVTSNSGSWSITPLAVTLTAGSYSGTYDGSMHAPSACASTYAGVTCTNSPATVSPASGSGTITPVSVFVTGNALDYTITSTSGAYSITRAAASITPNQAGKVYGTSDPALTGSTSGFLAADAIVVTYSRTPGEDVSGSPYTIRGTVAANAALANYNVTYNTASFTITQAQPTLAFAAIGAHTYGDLPFLVVASSASNGAVTYGVQTGPAGIGNSTGLVTLTGAGQVKLTASQASTSNYLSATATPVTINVARQASAASAGLSASSITPIQTVTLTAQIAPTVTGSATPTGSVTFYDGSTSPATALTGPLPLVNGSVQSGGIYLQSGAHVIYVVYAGDANYLGSTSSTSTSTTVTVAPEDFVFTTTGSQSQSVVPGSAGVFTFLVTPLYDKYPAAVTFTVTGLPPGATYTVSPASIPVNGGAQTVTVTIQTPAAVAMRTGRSVVWAMALLLPMALLRRRTRAQMARSGLLLLLLAAGAWGISGCGAGASNGFFGQAVKNYTVTITGTSGTMSHSTNVTLQVQ